MWCNWRMSWRFSISEQDVRRMKTPVEEVHPVRHQLQFVVRCWSHRFVHHAMFLLSIVSAFLISAYSLWRPSLDAMFRGGRPQPVTCIMMRFLIGHLDFAEDYLTFFWYNETFQNILIRNALNASQEICYRATLLRGWHAELEHSLEERLITPSRYLVRNIEELHQELEKLERWLYHMTMIDSMFTRWF